MADISVNSDFLIVSIGKQAYGVRFGSDEIRRLDSLSERKIGEVGETIGVNNANSEIGVNIVCCDISKSGKWAAACSSDKYIVLCDLNTWNVVSRRLLARAASRVRFTPNSNYIIVADKSGDAYKYSVNNPDEPGTLLLGHCSMLLDVLITPDQKFIITCDRDEKIRVSCFPNSYNIHSYCLGHTEFVTALNLLSHNNEVLISASGDCTLRFWDFKIGKELLCEECSKVLASDVVQVCKISSPDEENEANVRAVTAVVSTIKSSNSSILCTCFYNLRCCCVYLVSGNKDKLLCNLVQTVEVNTVPRALAIYNSTLWIMSLRKGDLLNVFKWDSQSNLFVKSKNNSENQAAKCINSHIKDDIDTRPVVPVLYKKKLDDGLLEYVQKKKLRLESTVQ